MGQGKVVGGLLDEPIAINSRGDVNRARVLPQVRERKARPAVAAPTPAPAPAGERESDDTGQAKSGFDYVVKRNRMLNKISGRVRNRSTTRRA